MKKPLRKKIYWTREKIEASARKYKTIKGWRINEPRAYDAACKKKIVRKITQNLQLTIRPKNFWNKKTIKEAIKNFKSFDEWIEKDKGLSYSAATRLGLLNDPEITGHLKRKEFKYSGKWTKDKILKDALLYNSRSSWQKYSGSAYNAANKKKINKEATKHMELLGTRFKRCLYIIEIKKKNKIYIGLTQNFKRRINEHLQKKFKKYKKNQLIIKKITGYLDKERAAHLEDKLILRKKKAGYDLLNISKGGGIGGKIIIWTKEKTLKSAKKYFHIKDWVKNNNAAYQAARKHGYFDEATKHMWEPERHRIWTKKKVLISAKKYLYRNDWKKNEPGAYRAALSQKWFSEATSHMVPLKHLIWTKEHTIRDAKKYNSKYKWNKKSRGAYQAAVNNDWFKEAVAHMKDRISLLKSPKKWQKQKVLLDAKKYKNRSSWAKNSAGAYAAAKRYGCFKKATQHMK